MSTNESPIPSTLASKKVEQRTLHLNSLQGQVLNADCKEMYGVCGRGTGKTVIIGIYEAACMHEMPRCTRLLTSSSYRKLATDILPGLVNTWERLGYRRDEHYVIGNSPIPAKFKWDDPYYAPAQSFRQFMIHWYTGAAQRFGSADRKVTMNGLNLDGITGDELKLIDEDAWKEILKTNRANQDRAWSHLPKHNSILGFTDKYWTKPGADWVMKKKALADERKVKQILVLQAQLNDMLVIGEKGELSYTKPALAARIEKLLLTLRNQTVAFFEAATYVNIPAISPAFIMQMKRNMGENEFRASILNHDIVRNDQKEYFYPLLDENEHSYCADNFDKIDNLGFDFDKLRNLDCTFDADRDNDKLLEISCDWGGNINCMVVCQEKSQTFNIINSFFVKHPQGIQQLADKFNNYYRPHKERRLRFYYDPSGNNKQANSAETLAEEFARHLRAGGWIVEVMSYGFHNNPQYELRYELFKHILQPGKLHNSRFPRLFINSGNCKEVLISMLDAPLRKFDKKLKKDKRSEKPGSGVLPEHATNFSDCVDYIVMHKYGHLLNAANLLPNTMGDI